MSIKTSIKEVEILVEATPGSILYECQQAAMVLAIEKAVPVTLLHNGTKYLMDPSMAMSTIQEKGDPPVCYNTKCSEYDRDYESSCVAYSDIKDCNKTKTQKKEG